MIAIKINRVLGELGYGFTKKKIVIRWSILKQIQISILPSEAKDK